MEKNYSNPTRQNFNLYENKKQQKIFLKSVAVQQTHNFHC